MKPEDFSKEKFKLKIIVALPLSDSFNLLSTAKGLTSWFLGIVLFLREGENIEEGADLQAGDSYHWKWQKAHAVGGKVLDYQRNERVAYTFGSDFRVVMSVKELKDTGKTEITLTQYNHDPKPSNEFSFLNCCVCWTFFLTNLKSVVENGIDLRETEIMDESLVNQ